jgi:hypothetical protein
MRRTLPDFHIPFSLSGEVGFLAQGKGGGGARDFYRILGSEASRLWRHGSRLESTSETRIVGWELGGMI